MAKNIIIIDANDRDIVQKADIEMNSRMNLISFMISRNMDIGERFKQYEDEYQKSFLAFEAAKTNIANKYLKDFGAITWSLNYENCELTYEQQ